MTDNAQSGAASSTWSPERSAAGGHSPYLIAVVVSLATFMEVLDTTVANVSLRHIAGGLAVGLDESTYVITSYLVANAIVLSSRDGFPPSLAASASTCFAGRLFRLPPCYVGSRGICNLSSCFAFCRGWAAGVWRPVSRQSLPTHFRRTNGVRTLRSRSMASRWWSPRCWGRRLAAGLPTRIPGTGCSRSTCRRG